MKQTITYKTAALGMVDVIVQANPYYRNTFTIGDKRFCFDNIVPPHIDLRKENFDLMIYDGVTVNCILSYGNRNKKTIEFELLTVYPKTEEIYPTKINKQ